MKKLHNISLDPDVSQIVLEEQEKGKLILSRFVNAVLREKYKEKLMEADDMI